MGAMTTLPPEARAHHGETVVEPGMVDGASIDMREAPLWSKTAKIKAVQMPSNFHVMTAHGRVVGSAGDWLAENPATGERWPILAADFDTNYVQEVPTGE